MKIITPSRKYFAVFTKLAKDPQAMFEVESHAKRHIEAQIKINTRSKFRIEEVTIPCIHL